ncbi:hypothetical protein AGLY_009767 [Aphis glycines]|uniref:Uncharacterized protein n=1 Tax=Aphis glycines TaxID=307491 RepID=A0A6G0THM5_APHGL|nr:hypothetical protein AGLY_009767 [Aphis glycines]
MTQLPGTRITTSFKFLNRFTFRKNKKNLLYDKHFLNRSLQLLFKFSLFNNTRQRPQPAMENTIINKAMRHTLIQLGLKNRQHRNTPAGSTNCITQAGVKWRCTLISCISKLFTSENETMLLKSVIEHKHLPRENLTRVTICNALKRKAVDDISKRPLKLILDEISNPLSITINDH